MFKHIPLLTCLFLFLLQGSTNLFAKTAAHSPKHFSKIMIVIFENMGYEKINQAPAFKKLLEYSGGTLNESNQFVFIEGVVPKRDAFDNGYAFFSQYYTNHNGGDYSARPSQPNYIAMTSGSTQGIDDNGNHDLDVDNLLLAVQDANLDWKAYVENLPDPKPPIIDQENNAALIAEYKKTEFNPKSGCFIGGYYSATGKDNDGYARKHAPFINYLSIQNDAANCRRIINAKQLKNDLSKMPQVSFYIPNLINDGHTGTTEERISNANSFLSSMLGLDPKTGRTLPDASSAPFQKFLSQGGLLVITFDEPSVRKTATQEIYTILIGKNVHSGAYPNTDGQNAPICYPSKIHQLLDNKDLYGMYKPSYCNHYNLLRMIENNWNLRSLDPMNTSAGYKIAYPLDKSIPQLWHNPIK